MHEAVEGWHVTCLSHDEGLAEAGITIFLLMASNRGDWVPGSLSLKGEESLAASRAFRPVSYHTPAARHLSGPLWKFLAFILSHFLSSYLLISFKTEVSTLKPPRFQFTPRSRLWLSSSSGLTGAQTSPYSRIIPRPSPLPLPTHTISTFPPQPRARLSGGQ